jgi:hypothetical protein
MSADPQRVELGLPHRLTVTIRDAGRFTGLSRSEIYRRLAAGELEARKAGTRTLITWSSLVAMCDALPTAHFRRG